MLHDQIKNVLASQESFPIFRKIRNYSKRPLDLEPYFFFETSAILFSIPYFIWENEVDLFTTSCILKYSISKFVLDQTILTKFIENIREVVG